MTTKEDVIKGIVGFLLSVGCFFFFPVVVADLWGWFIVPFGVGGLTYWHAMGLGLTVNLFAAYRMAWSVAKAEDDQPTVTIAIIYGLCILAAWGVGWAVSQAMP